MSGGGGGWGGEGGIRGEGFLVSLGWICTDNPTSCHHDTAHQTCYLT